MGRLNPNDTGTAVNAVWCQKCRRWFDEPHNHSSVLPAEAPFYPQSLRDDPMFRIASYLERIAAALEAWARAEEVIREAMKIDDD